MVQTKIVPVGNSTPLPKGVIQHAPDSLAEIVETVFGPAKQQEAKAPVATPAKKYYSGCKNNCTDIQRHNLLLPL
ncbi:MAG: hypothetical protein LUQ20_00695 [Candidatus Methanoperedens sp.]|nr:hypothetical protein [Candidatus Methanoperedens sp.]